MRRDTVLSPMICSLRQRISGRKHSFPASHFSFYMPEYFEFANYTSLTVLIFECILRQPRTMGTAGFGGSFAPIVQYEKWEIHPVFPHFPYFRLCQNLSPNLLAPLCGAALYLWYCPPMDGALPWKVWVNVNMHFPLGLPINRCPSHNQFP